MANNSNTTDLFIGAAGIDAVALIGDDEVLFGVEGTFAGSDSDVLACGDADDHQIEIDDVIAVSDDHDVLSTSADSDLDFELTDACFAATDVDVDVIEGDVWDLDIAA